MLPCGARIHANGLTAQAIKVAVSGATTTKASNRGGKHRPTTGGLPTKMATQPEVFLLPSKPVLPAHFKSDDKFFDSTVVGSGNHHFHRVIQSTDWCRKAQLAGRSVEDL